MTLNQKSDHTNNNSGKANTMKLGIRVLLAAAVASAALTGTIVQPSALASEAEANTTFGALYNCDTFDVNKRTTRAEALARSTTWIQARVPYSQSACHRNAHGSYRTDCSGYLSMIWGLRISYTTATLHQVSHTIPRADLKPGDALNRPGEHVAMFLRWADAAKTRPVVREQAGPNGSPTVERTWTAATANSYTPIRYNNIIDDEQPTPTGDYGIAGSASFRYAEQQHSFQRGADGSLEHLWWSDRAGVERENLGGRFVGEPVAYVHGVQQHIFARSENNSLAHWWFTPEQGWQRDDWGGSVTSNPTGFVDGGQQHVFARAADGSLQHFYYSASSGLQRENWEGRLEGDPVSYLHGEQQHVFAKSPNGTLAHWWYTPGQGVQRDDWGGEITGAATGFAVGSQQHVFGRGNDGSLRHWVYSVQGGLQQENWGGQIAGDPAAFLHGEQQHVFGRSASNTLAHWWYTPDQGVQRDDWGGSLTGDASGFAYGNQQQVFGRGADGTLTHWYWGPGQPTKVDSWGGRLS